MEPRFKSPLEWIAHCKDTLRTRDLDNVTVFEGDPGNGKSTLAFQIALALDPSFNVDRAHFTIPDMIEDARARERYQAVLADELLMHRRHSMTKESKEMIDFLQVCRGLNLHILLCFPHAGMMDRAVLDHRVRYRIKVPEQGLAVLMEREYHTLPSGAGEESYVVRWPEILRWRFTKNTGPMWEEYGAKKIMAAQMRQAEAKGIDKNSPGASRGTRLGDRRMRERKLGGQLPGILLNRLHKEGVPNAEEIVRKGSPQRNIPFRAPSDIQAEAREA